jgi:hypothetical protein
MVYFLFLFLVSLSLSEVYEWNGIIGSGQSLSVGAQSTATSKTQPFKNLKLSLGTVFDSTWPFDANSLELSLVPLTEPIRKHTTTWFKWNDNKYFLFF